MPGFLYFISGARQGTNPAELGLSYVEDERGAWIGGQCWPELDGQKHEGFIYGATANITAGNLGFYAERQTWRKIPKSDIWLGYYTDQPPAPDDLARASQVDGHLRKLEDGNRWLLPVARRWALTEDKSALTCFNGLPKRITLDDEGQWQPGAVKKPYEKLWQMLQRYEAYVQDQLSEVPDGEAVELTFESEIEIAVEAMRANYRVSAVELDALGLVDAEFMKTVFACLQDMPTYERLSKELESIKKKEGADLATV